MEDLWRKTLNFGLGVLDFTKEKVEALVAEMVKRGELTQQQVPQAIQEITARAKETQEALVEKVKDMVGKVVGEMKLARAADLKALEKRVASLEKELEQLKEREMEPPAEY
jgi:polyhydroxyalkanoate synthesis regulator phasin